MTATGHNAAQVGSKTGYKHFESTVG